MHGIGTYDDGTGVIPHQPARPASRLPPARFVQYRRKRVPAGRYVT
jgi:hypothetical protein